MKAYLCFGFSTEDWVALSPKLDSGDETAWAEAIDVFRRRIMERYFSCIDALEAADTKPDISRVDGAKLCIPGFAIVALCCLLIETSQSFRTAYQAPDISTGQCTFPEGDCIKPGSGTNQQFLDFLSRPAFRGAFQGDTGKKFNSGVRNGILHEAETRRWVIWREEPAGKIVDKESSGYALNRTHFYRAIKQEFESYLQELCDPRNEGLRERFKKKMNDLRKGA